MVFAHHCQLFCLFSLNYFYGCQHDVAVIFVIWVTRSYSTLMCLQVLNGEGPTRSQGVTLTGHIGSGKTAILEQLVNYSCFGDGKGGIISNGGGSNVFPFSRNINVIKPQKDMFWACFGKKKKNRSPSCYLLSRDKVLCALIFLCRVVSLRCAWIMF